MSYAILLSGGIDSAAVAYWKRPAMAFTVDYGQAPAEAEIHTASIIASDLRIPHQTVQFDLKRLGVGVLTGRPQLEMAPSPEWWPFRNQLLVTLGAMFAIREKCQALLVGTVASDGLHADGCPEFIHGIDTLVSAQEGGLRVLAPAAQMQSVELVGISGIPISLLAWCHSCHLGNLACGACRGCQKNREVRNAIGLLT